MKSSKENRKIKKLFVFSRLALSCAGVIHRVLAELSMIIVRKKKWKNEVQVKNKL